MRVRREGTKGTKHNCADRDMRRITYQEICDGFFVDGPFLGADAGFEPRVDGFEVDAGRYQLAGLGGFRGCGNRNIDGLF